MRIRRPPYTRLDRPPNLRLTERDGRILETIHAFDGLMSLRQIDRLFFSGRGGTWSRERMRALFDRGYVNMPDAANVHRIPLGETIYFLDKKGAALVAGLQGELPKDLPWRRQPRWSLIAHDLAVNDFRIAIMQSVKASRSLTLHRWVPESEFWAHPDTVEYETAGGRTKKRRVIPDGFFTIRRSHLSNPGLMEELAFLLEIDMGTEDNPRFAREKVRPGVAYLKSRVYRERFGIDYGRWLIVTTGEKRMANMKQNTENSGGSGMFYFTTYAHVSQESVLTSSIWHRAGNCEPSGVVITDPAVGNSHMLTFRFESWR